MNKYELEFRRVEEGFRPRKEISHKKAVDTLAEVCHRADEEIESLNTELEYAIAKAGAVGIFFGFVLNYLLEFLLT